MRIHPFANVWGRLRRYRLAVTGLVIILLVILSSLFAPSIAPFDPFKQDFSLIMKPTDRVHWFGTDQLGRDILSRVLFGSRITLTISFFSVCIGMILGSVIGLLAGFYGGRIDSAIVWMTDLALAFPGMLLAIAVIASVGPGLEGIIIATAVYSTPQFIRLARGSALLEKRKEYVAAASCIGETDFSILFRYVLPNCLAPLAVLFTLQMANVILIASGLSFLGLGAQPPSPEWGAMLSQGRTYLQTAPHLSIFPGMAIMVVVLSFNLFGDGLRDALDPRMRV
jgi:ABC-type dipeptide/oligopeptide/nickel transport system permease subunit